ncbi:class I SAM-dependent methyltransferase [Streptomyces sp. NPDC059003]|uniref:class I SAM-dependent methyltransferase n=1 Tax=Streptomyces sp. NPDC059003 TaxID=3346691 RepID=UPI0036BF5E44
MDDALLSQNELERFLKLAPSPRGRRVADFGCGTGKWTRQLAQWGAQEVTGYDSSPEALRLARRHERPGVTYESYDVNGDSIPSTLRPGSLHLVTCRYSLAYFDIEQFLTDVARWLTSDGALYVLTPVADEQPATSSPSADEDPCRRALPRAQLNNLLGTTWWARQRCQHDRAATTIVLQGPVPPAPLSPAARARLAPLRHSPRHDGRS